MKTRILTGLPRKHRYIIRDGRNRIVAYFPTNTAVDQVRLAVAAPEMLKALQDLRQAMEDGDLMPIHRRGLELLIHRVEKGDKP